jgi:hypothetical protein
VISEAITRLRVALGSSGGVREAAKLCREY